MNLGTIGSASVRFVGKDDTATALRSVVRNTETAQKQIASKLRAAFNFVGVGLAVTGLARAVNGAIQAGDDLAKFAQKSGLAAEAASELAHAARMTDIDLGALSSGVKFMQRTISEAASGSKKDAQLFDVLGISLDRLRELTPDQQFEQLAEQISRLKDPADRTRAAMELFGRAGADLLPMFEDGAEGIRKARMEAQQLGKSFSAEDLAKFQEADDAMKRMSASASGLADTLALKLGPAWSRFLDSLRVGMGGGSDRENLISDMQGRINLLKMSAVTEESAKELQQLQTRLDLLLNPKSDAIAGRGRVFDAGELPDPLKWITDAKKEAKATKAELEQLERFMNQPTQMRNDSASLFNTIAPTMAENDAAILGAMAEIREDGVAATSRVIELGEAYDGAADSAETLMETLKDESARQAFTAISDVVLTLGEGMDDFADSAIDAFKRILANSITQQLFELLGSLGGGGKDGGFLGFIGGLFSSFNAASPKAAGGPISAGRLYQVNEKGPEFFVPNTGGMLVPNHALAGAGGGGLNITVHQHNTTHVDSRSDVGQVRQIVDESQARNNQALVAAIRDNQSRGRRL